MKWITNNFGNKDDNFKIIMKVTIKINTSIIKIYLNLTRKKINENVGRIHKKLHKIIKLY